MPQAPSSSSAPPPDIQWDPAPVIQWDPPGPGSATAAPGLFQPPPQVTNPAAPTGSLSTGSDIPRLAGESLLDLAGLALPIAAGMRGASAGAQLAGKGAGWIPKLAASMAGAGTGTVVGGSIDRTLLATPPPRPGVPSVPIDLGQEARAMATDFVSGAAGEALVPAAGQVIRAFKTIPARIVSGAANRSATPATREASQFLGRIGAQPTPAQAGTSNWVRLMENVMEGSPVSRGEYLAVLKAQEDAFAREVDRILAEYGPPVTRSEAGQVIKSAKVGEAVSALQRAEAAAGRRVAEVGTPPPAVDLAPVNARIGASLGQEPTQQLGQRLLTAAHDAATQAANLRYNTLWQATDDAGVRISPDTLYDRAQQLLDATGELGAASGVLGRARPALAALKSAEAAGEEAAEEALGVPGAQLLQNLVEGGGPGAAAAKAHLDELRSIGTPGAAGEPLSARQLDRLRSFYGKMASDLTGPARGHFAQLAKAAETSLEEALEAANPKLVTEWRGAQAQYRTMKETFEEGALAKAAEANPKEFLSWVLGTKNQSVAEVIRAREVLDAAEPGAWAKVQAEAWRGISQLPDGTPRPPGQLLAQLRKYPEEHLRAIFGGHTDTLLGLKPSLEAAATTAKASAAPAVDKGLTTAVTAAQQLNPYTLVSKALKSASGEDILKLRTLVGADGWQKVQRLKLQEWFSAGADPAAAIDGATLFKRLPPMEQLKEIVGESRANYLYQFARVRDTLAHATTGSGQGKMWIQLQTPGAAMSVLSGVLTGSPKLVGAGLTILLTPGLLSKIALSPEMGKALIAGMSASAKHEPGAMLHFAGQLAAQLLRAGYITPDGQERDATSDAPAGRPTGAGPGPVGAPPPQLAGQGPGRSGGPGTVGAPPPGPPPLAIPTY